MARSILLVGLTVILAGCGGGGATSPQPMPQVTIDGIRPSQGLDANTPGYAGDTLSIAALLKGGTPVSIEWDFGGGATALNVADPDRPVVQLGPPGMYRGRVTVTDAAGLMDTKSFDYTVRAAADRIQSISATGHLVGQGVQFRALFDGQPESVNWTFESGTDTSSSNEFAPILGLTETGTHTVTLRATFSGGVIVSRAFPFTVTESPWSVIAEVPDCSALESLTLSDGSLALLLHTFTDGSGRLQLLRIPAGSLHDPDVWDRHAVGLVGATRDADLEEHHGRLGILYVVSDGAYYNHHGRLAYLATSTDLQPHSESDWQVARVGEYMSHRALSLAGRPGGGWQTLMAVYEDVFWAATSSARPVSSDWIMGLFLDRDRLAPSPVPTLALMPDGLTATLRMEGMLEVRSVTNPDMFALLEATPYSLANILEVQESGGRLIAEQGGFATDRLSILLSGQGVPRNAADWQPIDFSGANLSTNPGDLCVSYEDGRLAAIVQTRLEREDRSYAGRELWTRSLDVPASDWTREWLSVWDQSSFVSQHQGQPLIAWSSWVGDDKTWQLRVKAP